MAMDAMKKMVSYLTLGLLLQGCGGGGVLIRHSEMVRDPVVPDVPCPALYPQDLSKMTNGVVYTAAWLAAHWGKPAIIAHTGAGRHEEIWTYKFRLIWQGVVPVVIIPIPLALPVGREHVQFILQDGCVTSTTQRQRKTVGGAVGFGFGPCGGTFGAFSLEGFFE